MIFGTAATTATQKFRRPDSKSFCRFRDAAVPRNRQTGSTENSRSAHLYKLHFVSFVVRSAILKKPRNGGNFRDRMCNCNTVTRDAITITTWSGHPPRHPASVRTCSMWFPVHFRFLAHSLTTFGRWGCGERSDLSLDPVGIFFFFCGRAVCDCGAAGGCAICWLVSVLRNRQTPPPPRKGRKRG